MKDKKIITEGNHPEESLMAKKYRFPGSYGYIVDKNKAKKFDEGKLRYDLMPPEALDGTIKVMTFGAKKYSDRNWEKGLLYSRVFAALMRHMWAWWRGEDLDEETGLNHLHHAACCITFLQTFVERNQKGIDDRTSAPEPKPGEWHKCNFKKGKWTWSWTKTLRGLSRTEDVWEKVHD